MDGKIRKRGGASIGKDAIAPSKKKRKVINVDSTSTKVSSDAASTGMFPRGGASSSGLTSVEMRRIAKEARLGIREEAYKMDTEQSDAKEISGESKRSHKGGKSREKASEGGSSKKRNREEGGETELTKEEKEKKKFDSFSFIAPLGRKSLSQGFCALGLVVEVRKNDISLKLPGNAKATAKIEDERVQNAQSITVGMYLPCAVVSTGKELKVSIQPSIVNAAIPEVFEKGIRMVGIVESVEDHGYIVDVGTERSIFVPKSSDEEKSEVELMSKLPIARGSFVFVEVVKNVVKKEARVLRGSFVSCVSAADPKQFFEVQPGLLVKARLDRICRDGGLMFSFGENQIHRGLASEVDAMTDLPNIEPEKLYLCRVIGVDYVTRNVRLSMRPHLIRWIPFESRLHVDTILPVDRPKSFRGIGYIVPLPQDSHGVFPTKKSGKGKSAGENEIGSKVRVNAINEFDGVYVLSGDLSVLNVGDVVKGKVVKVLGEESILVEISQSHTALCGGAHLSKKGSHIPHVGEKIKARILQVYPKMLLTMNKRMMSSKTPIFSDWMELKVGMEGYGIIIRETDHGYLVEFYNQVKGIVNLHGHSKGDHSVGEAVRVRITRVDAAGKRLFLSLAASLMNPVGSILRNEEFIVNAIHQNSIAFTNGYSILRSHFFDFRSFESVIKEVRKGMALSMPEVAVIAPMQITAKPLLIHAIEEKKVPSDFSELEFEVVYTGYVRNIRDNTVFVSFLDDLIGASYTPRASNYHVGQVVHCKVHKMEKERKRVTLNLENIVADVDDKSFGTALFSEIDSGFSFAPTVIGSRVECEVVDQRDSAVVCKVRSGSSENIGVCIRAHIGNAKHLEIGSKAQANVIDVDCNAGILDLAFPGALQYELHPSDPDVVMALKSKKEIPDGRVLLVKENYVVVNIPWKSKSIVCFAPVQDYNSRSLVAHTMYNVGDVLNVRVLSGLQLKDQEEGSHVYRILGAILSRQENEIGEKSMVKVVRVGKSGLYVKSMSTGKYGVIHITRLVSAPSEKPVLESFHPGQIVRAFKISGENTEKKKRTAASDEYSICENIDYTRVWKSMDRVLGVVGDVEGDHMWVMVSPTVAGRLHIMDAEDPTKALNMVYKPGQTCYFHVRDASPVENGKQRLDFTTHDHDIKIGDVVWGKVLEYHERDHCTTVQLPFNMMGRIDAFHFNPERPQDLHALEPKSIARFRVLSLKKNDSKNRRKWHIQVSGDGVEVKSQEIGIGKIVHGFVRSVTSKGMFVDVGNETYARVKLNQLSTRFVKDPENKFPVGMFVPKIHIIDVDQVSGKIEASLVLKERKKDILSHEAVMVGEEYDGVVKKIVPYGMFVRLNDSKQVSGLLRVDEIEIPGTVVAEGEVAEHFAANQEIRVRVLQVDVERKRLLFTMKDVIQHQDDEDEEDVGETDEEDASEEEENDEHVMMIEEEKSGDEMDVEEESDNDEEDDEEDVPKGENGSSFAGGFGFGWGDSDPSFAVEAKGKWGEDEKGEKTSIGKEDEKKKPKSRSARALEEEKMLEVMEEERDSVVPTSPEDFDRLLLTSPNASYLWIQYMAFYIGRSQIEGARRIAKRAIEIISIREEEEKRNVWFAWLNLESQHGTEDSLEQTFRECEFEGLVAVSLIPHSKREDDRNARNLV
eukprot:TRINITY_DN389_c0_g1_i2.p1 TRINITY_DN389_c0_g1~~TRINITY_DN389_c0_g1_i2.p1  ORF type:complete len:1647 (-),score=558.97 TRINITY_DN389_c0_g1_i2:437-5377(-)